MAFQSDYQAYQCWKGGVDETGGDDVKRRDETDSVAKWGKTGGKQIQRVEEGVQDCCGKEDGGMREKVEDGTGNNRTWAVKDAGVENRSFKSEGDEEFVREDGWL